MIRGIENVCYKLIKINLKIVKTTLFNLKFLRTQSNWNLMLYLHISMITNQFDFCCYRSAHVPNDLFRIIHWKGSIDEKSSQCAFSECSFESSQWLHSICHYINARFRLSANTVQPPFSLQTFSLPSETVCTMLFYLFFDFPFSLFKTIQFVSIALRLNYHSTVIFLIQ